MLVNFNQEGNVFISNYSSSYIDTMRLPITRHPLKYFRVLYSTEKKHIFFPNVVCYYATTFDIYGLTYDFIERYKFKQNNINTDMNNFSIRRYMDHGSSLKTVTNMSENEIQEFIMKLLSKSKDNQIEEIITYCRNNRKFIGELTLKRLFRHYSSAGKPEMILYLQSYCLKVDPDLYRRNGKFMHFLAKAQCLKGNAEKGLSILKECYDKNEGLRSFYRIILRELIQDVVLNKSEASLVIFKRYVMDFSNVYKDYYPLICLWHLCWSSNWFSDQVLGDKLLEENEDLRNIVKDKATAFSISALKDYNEDAVMRLLQILLKYQLMGEYVKVLQVLFNFKLRNRDLRGCTEIIRNCELLGLTLPSDQQGRFLTMLILGETSKETEKPTCNTAKNFKLKF
ncbi:unnamed protein product [Diatraea saccharalis]|uniref:Uncharacterized protein n=1 Tax=Diatraea saccharalis TaxID=40085 RepID=A0A9N9RFH2_9NEOP|nr:unnamed protein product [Diatraea saccharalis]